MAYQSSYTGAEVDAAVASAQTAQQPPAEGAFVNGDKTKLDGVEALADVTDTANVTAAGALMDSEVTNLADVKAFDPTDYATATQGGLADSAVQPADDASGLGSGAATDGYVLTADGVGGAAWEEASGGGGSTDYVRTRSGTVQDLFSMADTWNDGATTFTAIKMDVTDTSSAAGSLLMDLQVGGVSVFSVGNALVEQKNGTNAQTYNLYNTYTDASNYERGFMKWNSNVLEIGTEAAGTGTTRTLSLLAGAQYLTLSQSTTLDTNALYTRFYNGSTVVAAINASTKKISIGSDGQFTFTSGTNVWTTAVDSGIARISAAKLKVTNGSTGAGELVFIVPTTDPSITGALWNNGGTLSISA